MKSQSQLIKITLVLFIMLWVSACNDENNETNDGDKTNKDVVEINDDNLITYLIPSPKDMFKLTSEEKLTYSDKVLNKKENAEKYIDTKSLEIGFGIYSADLAYVAAFNQTSTAGEYLKIVEDISDKIGLGAVFSGSLIDRFKKIESKDSLLKVTNDTYYDIVKFLEENDRNTSLSLISVGGWVESLYIVTNLQDTYSANNEIIQLIADQKNIFENLMLSLQQKEGNESINDVIKQLQPIKKVYDQLEVVKVEKTEMNDLESKKIVVGGTTKIVITEQQYNDLKKSIASVRNLLANLNV